MSEFSVIVIVILIIFSAVLYTFLQVSEEKLSIANMKNEENEGTIIMLNKEIEVLKELNKQTAENRRVTNEKMATLDSGELTPDDILPK